MADPDLKNSKFDGPISGKAAPIRNSKFSWSVLPAIILALLPIWVSLGDHPLHGQSESRYAAVSRDMADHNHWLIPHLDGLPHLTKPPLTYWAEAFCIRLLGPTELAVRIPSAVAGSLTLLLVLAAGWRLHDRRTGLTAMAILSIMPITVMINRLTLTDSPLTLFWFSTLAAGCMALREPTRRLWPVLMWTAVALGLLTKGPIAWAPIGLLLLWLALGRRWKEARALRLPAGLVLSAIPLLAWGAAVLLTLPGAAAIWYDQIVHRATGKGQHMHPEPVWFYIPIYLGGFLPATLLLWPPITREQWRRAWHSLRNGLEPVLWVITLIVPFVLFSLYLGKLASYLQPLAPAAALLAARAFVSCTASDQPRRVSARLADGLTAVLLILIAAALFAWALMPEASLDRLTASLAKSKPDRAGDVAFWRDLTRPLVVTIAATLATIAAMTACRNRWPRLRVISPVAIWIAIVAVWIAGFRLENRILAQNSMHAMLRQINQATGLTRPVVATIGLRDYSLPFYTGRGGMRVYLPSELGALIDLYGSDFFVVVDDANWSSFQELDPAVTARFQQVGVWPTTRVRTPRLILRAVPGKP